MSGGDVPASPAPSRPTEVAVAVRPFWRDPYALIGAGAFVYFFADAMQGKELTKENVVGAVFAAVVTIGRLAAPYVISFLPFLDKATKPKPGDGVKDPLT